MLVPPCQEAAMGQEAQGATTAALRWSKLLSEAGVTVGATAPCFGIMRM